jgi:hypothetical protein
MNIQQAQKKLDTWPEPWKGYAYRNVLDAQLDLLRWPELCEEILKDMTEAIRTREIVKNTGTEKEQGKEQP